MGEGLAVALRRPTYLSLLMVQMFEPHWELIALEETIGWKLGDGSIFLHLQSVLLRRNLISM